MLFCICIYKEKNPKYIIYINIKYIVLNLMNNNIYLNMHNHINDKDIKKSHYYINVASLII